MAKVEASDVIPVTDLLDRKICVLEKFAIKHRLNGAELPVPPPTRSYRNNRALYNAMEASLVKIENIAAALPRLASTGRSHIHAKLIDYDPGELFQKQLDPALTQLKKSAEQISKLGGEFGPACATIFEQVSLFEASVKAEASLISRASRMAKPIDPAVFKKECEVLVEASADAAELKYDIDVRSHLHNHGMALSDASAALGWVVAPVSLKHARDYKAIVKNLAEDILSRYIDLGCNPVHSDFAESLNAILDELVKYVEKEHPAGLRWNYAQGATPLGYRRAERNMRKDSHPIGDFYRLMHSGLTEFVLISKELGGVLSTIADYTLSTYEEMAKVIETASSRKRPKGETGGEIRMLLMSVQHEMTPLLATVENVPKSDKFAEHCAAFREFINSMQWCMATVHKMSPVGFIVDTEGVTLLYLNKLEKAVCKGDGYVHNLHKKWIASIRQMLVELKEYVKLHHPNELTFDTQRTRKSVDGLVSKSSLGNQLKELRSKSKSSRWKHGTKMKLIAGKGRVSVRTWIRSN